MTTKLADLRTMTMDGAKAVFARLAQATLRMERRAAAAEVRIAAVKAKLAEDNAGDAAEVAEAEGTLAAFILGNKGMFAKPRQVKTEFGKFGLRDATRVDIDDEEALVEALLENGYDDCLETVRRPVKDAILKRLEAGEALPGCAKVAGELVTCKVDRALVDEARKGAEG